MVVVVVVVVAVASAKCKDSLSDISQYTRHFSWLRCSTLSVALTDLRPALSRAAAATSTL